MAEFPRIVVAGYGAWGAFEDNPAALILDGLKSRDCGNCEVVTRKVPVVTASLYDCVEKALLELQPDAWIGLGVAASATGIRAEMVACNWRHFDVPDSSGESVHLQSIIDDGPVAYNADFPNEETVAALKAAGIPAEFSFSAGAHMCNQMLYTSRHLIETHGLRALCGFLHVPQTPAHVAKQTSAEPMGASMSLAMMTDAVAIAVKLVSKVLANSRTEVQGA